MVAFLVFTFMTASGLLACVLGHTAADDRPFPGLVAVQHRMPL
jgi:hypothetical protein